MELLDGLAALSSAIAIVGSAFGYFIRHAHDVRGAEARSLRDEIEGLYGRLAASDVPLDEHLRSEFYGSFRQELGGLVVQHFDRVWVSDYMSDPVTHQHVRDELEWIREMYLGPEDGSLMPPP